MAEHRNVDGHEHRTHSPEECSCKLSDVGAREVVEVEHLCARSGSIPCTASGGRK